MALKQTSIDMDLDLHSEIKARAAKRGISLQSAFDEGMRAWLGQSPPAHEEPDLQLRRAIEGLRALYISNDKGNQKLFRIYIAGLKEAGVLPQLSRRRKVILE